MKSNLPKKKKSTGLPKKQKSTGLLKKKKSTSLLKKKKSAGLPKKQKSTDGQSLTIHSPIDFNSTDSSEESVDVLMLKQMLAGVPIAPDFRDL